MKSLHFLLTNILADASICCGTTTTKDLKTIFRRLEHEGLSFLTITLGEFASDFEESLENKRIDPSSFRSFRKMKGGLIPRFLSGIVGQVFKTDGSLADHPSVVCISCVRQICRMWKKILLPCTKERVSAAIEGYAAIEDSMAHIGFGKFSSIDHSDEECVNFLKISKLLWGNVLFSLEKEIMGIVPNHGPGAVAERQLPNQKYVWTQWHSRLEPFFPASDFCYHNSEAWLEESPKVEFLSPDQEPPVRVITVPKTLKTPRIIAIEPKCMQYTQQALMRGLVSVLERHPLTRGHLNFTDQTINASLALESSRTQHLATLDLSEASDRVHSSMVDGMLRSVPVLSDAVFACRSTRAKLPSGELIHLRKFASMGSALCFPIESMVFFTILVQSELQRLGLRLSLRNIRRVVSQIYVYGDDLIIPVDGVPTATQLLHTFGMKVNTAKSFSKGNFRESCGMDAYDGVNVTPVYIRRMLPSSRHDVGGVVSAVAFSNQLYKNGYFKSCDYIEKHLAKLGLKIPAVSDTSACVGFVRDHRSLTIHRFNDKLHRPEVKGYVVVVREKNDLIDGHSALMKWFLKGLNPDKKHYLHSADSGRLAIKVRWCSVY